MVYDTDVDGSSAGGTTDEETDESTGKNSPSVTNLTIDPVTRVSGGGGLSFHAEVDLEEQRVLKSHSQATLFRGYENVLEGRDSRDAIDLSSRVCGDNGVVHSIASSMALEMAYPVEPPPMGVWARNMGQAAAFLYNHAGHLFVLAGPDYSAAVLSQSNPEIVAQANETTALRTNIHGYMTVGDIMAALNPIEGELYFEAIRQARKTWELASLMLGKYPHPSTTAPGGVTTTLTRTSFTQYYSQLKELVDYAKKVPPIWDDVLDFLLEHMDGFEYVGERPINMLSTGLWDDPDTYNARYEDADEWGRARLSTPGVIVDGELVTTDLTEIDANIEEFVEHAFYEDWTDGNQRFAETPTGDAISHYHPWNKETWPDPGMVSWDEQYTWSTAPRWNRHAMECGAHARQWITALAREVENPFIEPTGDGINLTVPEVALPEVSLRWDIPNRLNAAERLRAKAYHLVYAGLVCYVGLIEALDILQGNEANVHTTFTAPSEGTHHGVGFWESGRGAVTHHVVIEDGVLDTYQILTPSAWATSPPDPFGQPGPHEEAVRNTPLLETYTDESEFSGVDVLRAIRSFDPCMVCAAH